MDLPVIAFARKKKDSGPKPKSTDASAVTSKQISSSSSRPASDANPPRRSSKSTSLPPPGTPSDAIPARWRRRGALKRQEAEYKAYVAELRDHFAEVDAFELAVETPTPPGKAAADAAHAHRDFTSAWAAGMQPRAAMSLGLSRRSTLGGARLSLSLVPSATPTPLRLGGGDAHILNNTLNTHTQHRPLPPSSAVAAFSQRGQGPCPGSLMPPPPPRVLHPNAVASVQQQPRLPSSTLFTGGRAERGSASMAPPPPRGSRAASSVSVASVLRNTSLRFSEALHRVSMARRSSAVVVDLDDRDREEGEEGGVAAVETPSPGPSSTLVLHDDDSGVLVTDKSTTTLIGALTATEAEEVAEETSGAAVTMYPIKEEDSSTPEVPSRPSNLSTPSALGLELAEKLTLEASTAAGGAEETKADGADISPSSFANLPPLEQLLRLCGQEGDVESLPSMEELLGRHVDLKSVKKIGEGTFGEAFKAGDVVLKIVPMEGSVLVNGEPQKRAEEILAEAAITLTLSGLRPTPSTSPDVANATGGFVETHGVGVCRGVYAPSLLAEWRAWDERNRSENDCVDIFQDDQLYVVFVVGDGGADLERFEPRSFAELRSIMLQTAMTLAVAEEACGFEHRDLHWGNLLVRRDGSTTARARLRGIDIEMDTAGVTVTLIDFTLSRLVTPEGEVAFCDLSADPELFAGPKGDPQAETYRRMRKATGDNWAQFTPETNVYWLRYLAETMLAQKLPAGATGDDRRVLRNFRKAAAGCETAGDMVWNELFDGMWRAGGGLKVEEEEQKIQV